MNNHAKQLCKHLESLDFRRDYDAEEKVKSGTRVYRHANEPSSEIKVAQCMNDFTITTQMRNANRIIGLSSSSSAPKLKERVKAERKKKNAQQKKAEAERAERGAKAEAEYQIKQKIAAKIAERREFEQLMRHGYGR